MSSTAQQISKKFEKHLSKNLTIINCFVLILLPIVAILLSSIFNPNFLISILLFLGLPAIYISCRASKYIFKSIIFSLIASIPLMIILEYVGGFSQAWAFPESFFSYLILGRVSIEVLLWAFFNTYTVVIFYEYIFDNHRKVYIWNKKMWTLVRYLLVWVIVFILVIIFSSKEIIIPYFYLLFGLIIFIFPILMTWIRYPRNLTKILSSLVYFSYLSLLYEITALIHGWWYFPGTQFIGHITLLNISFPIEEFVFWIVLFAPAVISAFEYLDDDCK